jgi:hypothetical protein
MGENGGGVGVDGVKAGVTDSAAMRSRTCINAFPSKLRPYLDLLRRAVSSQKPIPYIRSY